MSVLITHGFSVQMLELCETGAVLIVTPGTEAMAIAARNAGAFAKVGHPGVARALSVAEWRSSVSVARGDVVISVSADEDRLTYHWVQVLTRPEMMALSVARDSRVRHAGLQRALEFAMQPRRGGGR